MLIDWFTVGAQALNFVVLVWLMKRFLYQPVLDAIDVRERRIAAQLVDADRTKAVAQDERDDLQHRNDAFDQQRVALLAAVTAEAGAERKRLLNAACEAADALTAARQQTLANDAKNLNQALRRRTQAAVFDVARRALTDLATAGLEASVCELFIVRLTALEGPVRDDLEAALEASRGEALVRTAFELPTAQRSALVEAIDDLFATKVVLRFEVVPDVVCGIELSVHGHKFAWSIADYLASLERGVDELLTPDKPAVTVAVTPAPTSPSTPAPDAA